MNIRIESQNIRIRMELEELKKFQETGYAEMTVGLGLSSEQKIIFQLRLHDQFYLEAENQRSGFNMKIGLPKFEVESLLEIAKAPVAKKKLVRSYPCNRDRADLIQSLDFELDAFSLREQVVPSEVKP